MGNANIPTSSPCSTSDDESPVSIIFLSVVVLSQDSHAPRLQHCKLVKTHSYFRCKQTLEQRGLCFVSSCVFVCSIRGEKTFFHPSTAKVL